MRDLRLQRNVQFLYEEHLARVELEAFGCDQIQRDAEDPWHLAARVNGRANSVIDRSAYIGTLDNRETVYSQLVRPKYQGGQFNRTRSVNQYLTHWIYPYRGKFHPQMIRALLNTANVTEGSVVLDPYVGSGTTALEASLLGIRCIGVDLSPLCTLMTRVKTGSHFATDAIRDQVALLLGRTKIEPRDPTLIEHEMPIVRDFLQLARMVTFSDSARRRRSETESFRRNLQAMAESVEAHARAIRVFEIEPGQVSVHEGDARALGAVGLKAGSVDAIVTSPPYSVALDYVKNDQHALAAMGVDLARLRADMTGVRGRGTKDRLALYEEDMRAMFCEVERVLRPNAPAVFVVGDATIRGREAKTTAQMTEWAEEAGLRCERQLPKIVYGLYSVMQQEKIMFFRKPES